MNRALQVVRIPALLLAVAAGLGAQKGNPKQPKAPPPPPQQHAAPAKGMPKAAGANPGGGPRLSNPMNQFERLIAMPPDKRDQVLEKLPPAQQTRLRERLDQFDKLPPQQKALRLELANRYFALPPEKQAAYARQVQAVNAMSPDRRQAVVRELRTLWRMPEGDRQERLASEDFKSRFSPSELQALNELSATNVLPR
ncbi:MAG TPA: DUF3106 domain-containing protein [Candidatus Acidoferrales bacterium]|nr:DUF3106 domain-containing protein [Candidatus Acidoferrales bacterium]